MEVRLFDTAAVFLDTTRGMLEGNTVANQLILANAVRLAGTGSADDAVMAAVFSGSVPVMAALMTPPHRLLLSLGAGIDSGAAADALAAALAAQPLPGVLGPIAAARRFAERHCAGSGAARRTIHEMGIYKLTRVIPPQPVPGRLRPATEEDQPLMEAWRAAFWTDAQRPWSANEVADSVRKDIADGFLYLWDDAAPACTAACRRPLSSGIAIGGVYTPPGLRRRGYASACVAALSQRLLDSGYAWCSLFTDLANPTSNRIYQAIGYEPVCEVVEFAFEPKTNP